MIAILSNNFYELLKIKTKTFQLMTVIVEYNKKCAVTRKTLK